MNAFRATVDRVIDGDTVWMRFRLRTTTSAPGAGTKNGRAATELLRQRMPRGKELLVRPITVDQYGRVIAQTIELPK